MKNSDRRLDPDILLSSGSLRKRLISAAILIPVVLGAVLVGGWIFSGMVAVLCVMMVFEWMRMVEQKPRTPQFYVMAAGALAGMGLAANGFYAWGVATSLSVGALGALMAMRGRVPAGFIALTPFYIVVPSIALLWLRNVPDDGQGLVLLLFFTVWAADSGAFFLGKFIGGPKISYALSPSKTWAGICGGVIGGTIIAPLAGFLFLLKADILFFVGLGAVIGAASVAGDLAESAFKRKFGLKDISGIIPGHGGVLDRLDGMIFATIAMTATIFLYMLS